MLKKFMLVALVVTAMVSPCRATLTNLTANSLGLKSGNYGASLEINNFLQITSLTNIGQCGGSKPGTVYLASGETGFGVQSSNKRGDTGINGSGSYADEALVLDFIQGAAVSSIKLGLSNYDKCSDNPSIDLVYSDGDKVSFSKSSAHWNDAISSTGSGMVVIDIATFLGTSSRIVSCLTVTEHCGQIYVNGVGNALVTVPEPATLALLGFGCFMVLPIRRQKSKSLS